MGFYAFHFTTFRAHFLCCYSSLETETTCQHVPFDGRGRRYTIGPDSKGFIFFEKQKLTPIWMVDGRFRKICPETRTDTQVVMAIHGSKSRYSTVQDYTTATFMVLELIFNERVSEKNRTNEHKSHLSSTIETVFLASNRHQWNDTNGNVMPNGFVYQFAWYSTNFGGRHSRAMYTAGHFWVHVEPISQVSESCSLNVAMTW
jgi:hypothetical protein